jgi:hypothetical protein
MVQILVQKAVQKAVQNLNGIIFLLEIWFDE